MNSGIPLIYPGDIRAEEMNEVSRKVADTLVKDKDIGWLAA